jgi:hypothetical protein
VKCVGSDEVDMTSFPFHLLFFSHGNANFWKTIFSLAYFLELGVIFGAVKASMWFSKSGFGFPTSSCKCRGIGSIIT